MSGEDLRIQEQALLERVERATRERCAALQAQTRRQCSQILEEGRTQARTSLRAAVREERARGQQARLQAQAQGHLEQRQREQAQLEQLLSVMWRQLPAMLAERWEDPAARRAWIEAALEAAGTLLPGRPWTLELASALSQEAQTALEAQACGRGAAGVRWVHDARTGPGIRIRAEGACVSATVEGLLARRADIEAAFLALYHTGTQQTGHPAGAQP